MVKSIIIKFISFKRKHYIANILKNNKLRNMLTNKNDCVSINSQTCFVVMKIWGKNNWWKIYEIFWVANFSTNLMNTWYKKVYLRAPFDSRTNMKWIIYAWEWQPNEKSRFIISWLSGTLNNIDLRPCKCNCLFDEQVFEVNEN